jgi:hypothetical protein
MMNTDAFFIPDPHKHGEKRIFKPIVAVHLEQNEQGVEARPPLLSTNAGAEERNLTCPANLERLVRQLDPAGERVSPAYYPVFDRITCKLCSSVESQLVH